jgi:hypothetical protein
MGLPEHQIRLSKGFYRFIRHSKRVSANKKATATVACQWRILLGCVSISRVAISMG